MNTQNPNENYGTLSETINELAKIGYTEDFNIQDECVVCHKANMTLSPDDFQIDHVYRFDSDSDPDYQSILYAISSTKFNVKGVLVNGYGISSDTTTNKLISKLKTHHESHLRNTQQSATPLRPEGDRVITAPMVELNLNTFITQVKSESTWTNSDKNSVTLFKSDTLRIVLMGLHMGAELRPHKANGVISVQVLEGEIEFTAEEQIALMKKGQMIALQENIVHSVKAKTESFFLLTLALNK